MGDGTLIKPRVVGRLSFPAVEPVPAIAKDSEITRDTIYSAFSAFERTKTSVPKELATHSNSRESLLPKVTTMVVNTYKLCRTAIDSQKHTTAAPQQTRVLTKPSMGVHNYGYDNENWDLIIKVDDVFLSNSGLRYIVLDMLGQGTFGQVAKCFCEQTQETVALKVIKNQSAYYHQARVEIGVLQYLNRSADPDDRHHIVRLRDFFLFRNHLCLVFELLSVNLYELIKHNQFRGLSMHLVRVFIQQILETLIVLRKSNIIHCDLKPENVLLKGLDSGDIKVIDFGSACFESKTVYSYIQSRFYRSPEVVLGYPYTVAIDIWSLGCMTAELFLGLPLFPGASEHDLMTRVVEVLGLPPGFVLDRAKHTSKYFKKTDKVVALGGIQVMQAQYAMRSAVEFEAVTGQKATIGKRYFKHGKLSDVIYSYPSRQNSTAAEAFRDKVQRDALLDFLLGVLDLNPETRWTPQQAILHPFVTNQPFHGHFEPPREAVPQVHAAPSAMSLPTPGGSFSTQHGWPSSTNQSQLADAATILVTSPHVQAHVAALAAIQAHLSPQMHTPRGSRPTAMVTGTDTAASSYHIASNSLTNGSSQNPNSFPAIAAAAAAAAAASYGSYQYGSHMNQFGYSPASRMQIDMQPFFTPTGSLSGTMQHSNLGSYHSGGGDMQYSPINHSLSTYQLAAAAAVAAANAAAAAVQHSSQSGTSLPSAVAQQSFPLQSNNPLSRVDGGVAAAFAKYVGAAQNSGAAAGSLPLEQIKVQSGLGIAHLQGMVTDAAGASVLSHLEQQSSQARQQGGNRNALGAAASLDQSMAHAHTLGAEDSVSPSPGDWDPLYSDELLLADDNVRSSKKQCDESKSFNTSASLPVQLPTSATEPGAGLLGQALLNSLGPMLSRTHSTTIDHTPPATMTGNLPFAANATSQLAQQLLLSRTHSNTIDHTTPSTMISQTTSTLLAANSTSQMAQQLMLSRTKSITAEQTPVATRPSQGGFSNPLIPASSASQLAQQLLQRQQFTDPRYPTKAPANAFLATTAAPQHLNFFQTSTQTSVPGPHSTQFLPFSSAAGVPTSSNTSSHTVNFNTGLGNFNPTFGTLAAVDTVHTGSNASSRPGPVQHQAMQQQASSSMSWDQMGHGLVGSEGVVGSEALPFTTAVLAKRYQQQAAQMKGRQAVGPSGPNAAFAPAPPLSFHAPPVPDPPPASTHNGTTSRLSWLSASLQSGAPNIPTLHSRQNG